MVDSALPQPGDIIASKYRIERSIGDGGMSVVFGATHCVTGKRFAIKWLLPDDEAATSALAAQRFIREAQVAGLFQHPNVVEVYDVGEVSGSFYMVMEWLEGESLDARLARLGRLSLKESCAHLIPCMQGIEDAHAVGIVHRDLKPANIFVCRATKHAPERAKVLDFGIAKLTNPKSDRDSLTTQAGVLIGTPSYFSPEQLRNQAVDHRTDIYAFGVVLYQVLSGELPFAANTFGELVMQIATATPRPLEQLAPELPPGVARVVARAMAREPADRFQDLHALIAALQPYADAGFAHTGPARASSGPHTSANTPLSTEAKAVPAPPRARSLRLSVQIAVAVVCVGIGALAFLQLADRDEPVDPLDARAPPLATVPTRNERAAATPTPAPTSPDPVVGAPTPEAPLPTPDSPSKSAQPLDDAPHTVSSNSPRPDAGIAPQSDAQRPKVRVRAAHSDVPARVPIEDSPPPSAPHEIDHNPLHMHIQ